MGKDKDGADKKGKKPAKPDGSPQTDGKLGKGQQIGLLVAIGLMLIGGALWLLGPAWADKPIRANGSTSGVTGLAPGGGGEGDPGVTEQPPTVNEYSPAIFTAGLSFVVAFAMAYAARMFLRISLIAVGVFALALMGLEYVEVLTINWGRIEGHYDSFMDGARESFSGFREFVTGRLPSAGAAVAGLVMGFRKR